MRYLTLEINGKLMPMHRGDIYEDPLQEALESAGIGGVDGGGSLLDEDGSVACCDVHVELAEGDEAFAKFLEILDGMDLPKGSFLHFDENEDKEPLPLGRLEGLALGLNGTDLPAKVYKECDINHAITQILGLLGEAGDMYSHWRGPKHTYIYFYGTSFEEMKRLMLPFLEEYPLCQKCEIFQIA